MLRNRYEPDDVGDENEIEVEFQSKSKRILFKVFYKVIAKTEDSMTAVCRNCKFTAKHKNDSFSNFRKHLKVCDI